MDRPKLNLLDLPNKWIVEIAKKQLPENISLLASTCQSMYRILKESRRTYIKRLSCLKKYYGNNKEKNNLDRHHCIYQGIYFENFTSEQDIREIVVRLVHNGIFADNITAAGKCPVIREMFDLKPKGIICREGFDFKFLPEYKMNNICIGAVSPKDFEDLTLRLLPRAKNLHLRISGADIIDVTNTISQIASLMSWEGSQFKLEESPVIFDVDRFKTRHNAPNVQFDFEDYCFYPNRCEITTVFYPARGGAVVIIFDNYNGKRGVLTMKFCSTVTEADDFMRLSLTGCKPQDYNFEAWFPEELLISVFV